MGEQERTRAADATMTGLRTVPAHREPDPTTRSMLEGLASLHPTVLAIDARGCLIWINDGLGIVSDTAAISHHDGTAASGGASLVGRPLTELLRAIWSDDLETSKPQTLRFIDDMKKNGRVVRARFDLGCESREGPDPRQDQANESLPLEVSAFRMRDSANRSLVVCLIDRHEPRASLEQKNDELEACVRGLSHDLRSPLVSLLGFSQLLREDYGQVLDRSGLHFVSRINEAARHIEQLLQDMLELSRIGACSPCRVPVNPKPILEQLHAELKWQLDEENIELVLPVNPPTLICDRTRLYQLFSNLIGNAIHHMGRASSARIEVELETVSDGWQITVSDNGRGIPAEDHERIFRAFEAMNRPSSNRKSSGLGLAIVKKIVESHSGRVWVESEPGEGARFVVQLPTG